MNPAYPPIHFDDRLFRIICIPVIGFVHPLIFSDHTLSGGLVAYLPIWLVATIYGWVY